MVSAGVAQEPRLARHSVASRMTSKERSIQTDSARRPHNCLGSHVCDVLENTYKRTHARTHTFQMEEVTPPLSPLGTRRVLRRSGLQKMRRWPRGYRSTSKGRVAFRTPRVSGSDRHKVFGFSQAFKTVDAILVVVRQRLGMHRRSGVTF